MTDTRKTSFFLLQEATLVTTNLIRRTKTTQLHKRISPPPSKSCTQCARTSTCTLSAQAVEPVTTQPVSANASMVLKDVAAAELPAPTAAAVTVAVSATKTSTYSTTRSPTRTTRCGTKSAHKRANVIVATLDTIATHASVLSAMILPVIVARTPPVMSSLSPLKVPLVPKVTSL